MTGTTGTTKSTPAPAKATRRGTKAPAPTGPEMLAMLGGVVTKGTKPGKAPAAPKPEAVKQTARRDLAHLLVQAYANALTDLPADSPIRVALGAEIDQIAASWIHHLPVVDPGQAWDIVGLPVPDRSNWVDGKRK